MTTRQTSHITRVSGRFHQSSDWLDLWQTELTGRSRINAQDVQQVANEIKLSDAEGRDLDVLIVYYDNDSRAVWKRYISADKIGSEHEDIYVIWATRGRR
jgi:hypothetical protein